MKCISFIGFKVYIQNTAQQKQKCVWYMYISELLFFEKKMLNWTKDILADVQIAQIEHWKIKYKKTHIFTLVCLLDVFYPTKNRPWWRIPVLSGRNIEDLTVDHNGYCFQSVTLLIR